jgi:hypothetical protein
MEVSSAVDLVNALIFKPEWKIHAEDHTHRFEGTVVVHIEYPAHQYNRADAPAGYPTALMATASFRVMVSDCMDDTGLYRRILEQIAKIDQHEAREALRVLPTYWSPFHPHKTDGMKRWGDMEGDLAFGSAS